MSSYDHHHRKRLKEASAEAARKKSSGVKEREAAREQREMDLLFAMAASVVPETNIEGLLV